LAGSASRAESSESLKEIIEAAGKEGTLNVSYPQSVIGGSSAVRQIESQMNAMFGTNIRINYVPAVSIVRQSQQLILEYSAGQKANTDLYIAPASSLAAPLQRGVFTAVDWHNLLPDRIKPAFVEADGRLLRFGVTFPVIVYNTQSAPFVPATLEDMLRPEWKGKFATHRFVAGFEVLGAKELWGSDRIVSFMQRWSDQIGGLIQCGAEVERIASGEYAALAMDCIGGNTISWQQRGAPVDFVIPRDAAELHYYYLALPNNATFPNAAKLLALFMLSEAGQKLNWDTWKVDLDGLPGSRVGAEIAKIRAQGTKFVEVTIDWWLKHPEVADLQDRLGKIVQRKQ
jgi:iron(III) transport system substrate-binding protein